jgi:hypothetical protein
MRESKNVCGKMPSLAEETRTRAATPLAVTAPSTNNSDGPRLHYSITVRVPIMSSWPSPQKTSQKDVNCLISLFEAAVEP